ncbi:hypothetical protein G7078_02350 [Sphingomonas sinipercae]|uniref:Uncharacterized protein n=1 Tax=Sphingomonas sinipercae TaxID=2714944 RepID=A0A6G7ZL88_9SPHN|nr:hypothetical protein [Sphingomonas sinipercae]QIL01741.1 hypothetical protein G7078_02350 [Sphingomonas sinipercae]
MTSTRLFLHELRLAGDEAMLLPVAATGLRSATFLDGRENFSAGQAQFAGAAQFLAGQPATADARFIFHIGFCGSTLLSRLLDVPGATLVLREPHCLANIVNQPLDEATLQSVLPPVIAHLSQPWAANERVVIKPSNWANALLGRIVRPSSRAVFMTDSRQRFLTAVLRGGQDRVAFTARLAARLGGDDPELGALVGLAAAAPDADRQLARLVLVAHEIQLRRFRDAASTLPADRRAWVSAAALDHDPMAVLGQASAALDLALAPEQLAANVERWSKSHAKDPGRAFSPSNEASANAAVAARFGALIADTLDWAGDALGPEPREPSSETSR